MPAECGFAYPTYTHIGPTIDYLERAYDDAKHGDCSRAAVRHAGRTELRRRHDRAARQARRAPVRRPRPVHAARRRLGTRRDEFAQNVLQVDGRARARLLRRHHRHAGAGAARHRGASSARRTGTSSTASCRSTSCSSRARRRISPITAAPIAGLYQCGSSAHPGGGVGAVAGHNAAREILRDWKR